MKEIKDMMLQQREAVLEREIARADTQMTEIESRLQQLSVGSSTQPSEESEQSRKELLWEIRQQQASNDTLRKMCEKALTRAMYERTRQKIKGVKANNDSSALAGFINASGEETKIDQDISDVSADNRSVAVAGVIKGLNFKDLRPSWPTDDMARGQQ